MKKWMCALLALGMLLSLCTCGHGSSEGTTGGNNPQKETTGSKTPNGTDVSTEQGNDSNGSLSLLFHLQRKDTDCCTENGFYYLSDDVEKTADGRNARHLMYMDFATHQEIYLCSNTACSHDTVDCTSVFPIDEFSNSSMLFTCNGKLYVMSKEMDREGSGVVTMGASGDSGVSVEAAPTVLYRINLDGTNREKIYTFESGVTVEDFAIGDENGFYLITKKLSTQQSGGSSYQTSSERKLIFLDLHSLKETALYNMDFSDQIEWDVIGCTKRQLILHGIDFGRKVSWEEKHSDDTDIYDTASDVFCLFNVDNGERKEFYRAEKAKSRSFEVDENNLYYSVDGDGQIISVNLHSSEQKTLCTISQDAIWGMIGDRIYTRDSNDSTYYFIDVNTGEISHSSLVNKSLGWSIEIIAETSDQALIVYDYDAISKGDGSYSIEKKLFGLIGKDDLYTGRDSITPIQMIGSGM